MNCTNCGNKLSCGCQKKVASDGKQVCTQCKDAYEKKLQLMKSDPNNINLYKTR